MSNLTSKITSKKVLKKIHQWLAVLIGLQVIIWLVSGIAFGFLDTSKVTGKKYLNKKQQTQWQGDPKDFNNILNRYENIISIKTNALLNQPVYHVKTTTQHIVLDGKKLSEIIINKTLVNQVAKNALAEKSDILQTTKINQLTDETRKFQLPVWQVRLNDVENSNMYIDASTAQVLKLKTDTWRLFDFLWMMHIMDYSGLSDINNALIIFAALVTCFFVLSGVLLIFSVFDRQDFVWFKQHKKVTLTVITGKNTYQLEVSKQSILINALANKQILLPTTCGGGGECGRCWIKLEGNAPISEEEMNLFKQKQLNKGIRLACQQKAHRNMTINIATI